jgi:hypothetical protein
MRLPHCFLPPSGFQSKLDYIKSLGVKGVALSSILKVSAGGSEEAVEDFQDVDPHYGTLAEFKALIASLKSMGKCFLNIFITLPACYWLRHFHCLEGGPHSFVTPAPIHVCIASNKP